MNNYYVVAWTRAAPFFVGMIYGYILNIYKGKEIRLNLVSEGHDTIIFIFNFFFFIAFVFYYCLCTSFIIE